MHNNYQTTGKDVCEKRSKELGKEVWNKCSEEIGRDDSDKSGMESSQKNRTEIVKNVCKKNSKKPGK